MHFLNVTFHLFVEKKFKAGFFQKFVFIISKYTYSLGKCVHKKRASSWTMNYMTFSWNQKYIVNLTKMAENWPTFMIFVQSYYKILGTLSIYSIIILLLILWTEKITIVYEGQRSYDLISLKYFLLTIQCQYYIMYWIQSDQKIFIIGSKLFWIFYNYYTMVIWIKMIGLLGFLTIWRDHCYSDYFLDTDDTDSMYLFLILLIRGWKKCPGIRGRIFVTYYRI